MNGQPFDLCLGGYNGKPEAFLEFKGITASEDAMRVFKSIQSSHGWDNSWATLRDGRRSQIVFHLENMPTTYRWHCLFENQL